MITQENGYWRSAPTRDEKVDAARNAIGKLTPAEYAAFREICKEIIVDGRSETAAAVTEFEWEENPMPVREWLMDPDMMGETGRDMYPTLRDDFCELFSAGALALGGYYEAVLTGAIGWGKDYFATAAVVRMLYELLCLKNPQHTLGLAAGEPIHIVPISKTVAAARRVVFGGVCKKLNLSKWFNGKFVETMEEVRFKKKSIYIVGGASQDASALGLNVICAVIDECVTEDTRILTPSGYQPISALYDSSMNDQLTFGPILSYDEKTGQGRVNAGFIRPATETDVFEVELDDGRIITATARHPFMVRRPWSDLDYVFLKDLKIGDEVVVVHDAQEVARNTPEDQALEPADEGTQGRDRRGLVPGQSSGGLGITRARANAPGGAHANAPGSQRKKAQLRGSAQDCDGADSALRESIGDQRRGSAGQSAESACRSGTRAHEGRGHLQEAEGGWQTDHDARAAGWYVGTDAEAMAGACLPGPDDRYEASLFPFPRGEGEDWECEPQAQGGVQAQRGDEAEDQRKLGVESEEGGLLLSRSSRYEERFGEAWEDGNRLPILVGEARHDALGRGLRRSQFPVRTIGCPLRVGWEPEVHDPRLLSDDDGWFRRDDRGQTTRVYKRAKGTGEGRRLLAILRGAGLEVRSVGRSTSVARIVSITRAGSHPTFDVMSLPGGNFIAEGVVVHNSNFLGEGKVTTGSASGQAEDKATMIYNALARRVKSRYSRHGVSGLVMLVSSKRSTEDFTEQRIRRAVREADPGLFVRDYATWHVHPEAFADSKWYKVLVSPKMGRTRLLEGYEESAIQEMVNDDPNCLVFDFPDEYLSEFRNDCDGSTRDFGGIATDFAGRLFFSKRQAIDEMADRTWPRWFTTSEWETNRVLGINWDKMMDRNVHGDPVPACCAGAIRHVHIDLSTTHCATGFAMGHIAGSKDVYRRNPENPAEKIMEEAPIIHIDCCLRIVAPQGEEVDHGEVRGLVYRLMEKGVPIRSVSMDQYMAPSNLQLFKRRGLRTAEVGERKAKLHPYLASRQALYEGRVISAHNEALTKELKDLELDKTGKKVKHPPKGAKDLADAWAGVIYYISENMRSSIALGPSTGVSELDLGGGARWTADGDVLWGDEDDLPPPSSPENGQSFPPCII